MLNPKSKVKSMYKYGLTTIERELFFANGWNKKAKKTGNWFLHNLSKITNDLKLIFDFEI